MLASHEAMCYTFAGVSKGGTEKMLNPSMNSNEIVARTVFQPMSFMDILEAVFSLYRNHFRLIVGICAVYFIFTLGVNLFTDISALFLKDLGLQGLVIAIGPVATWITILVGLFSAGALLFTGAQIYLGEDITAGAAFMQVARRFGSYLGSFLLWMLVVGVLALTIIGIPFSIYLGTRWGLYAQAALIEEASATNALKRSRELVRGAWWRVFGIMLALFLLAFMIQIVLQFFLLSAFGFTEVTSGEGGPLQMFQRMLLPELTDWNGLATYVIHRFINDIVNSLMLPLTPIGITLLYFDLRIRKEGFGTELHVPNETE